MLRLSLNDQYVFNEVNTKAKEFTEMKILVPSDVPIGTIQNVMLTTPSCESRAPISKEDSQKYDMKEFNYNTYIFYKSYGKKTRVEAKQICEREGQVRCQNF